MKRSVHSLFALAVGLAASMLGVLSWAWRGVSDALTAVFAGPKLVEAPTSRPAVVLRSAKQFVLRIVKRDRPVVTPRWRMCPST